MSKGYTVQDEKRLIGAIFGGFFALMGLGFLTHQPKAVPQETEMVEALQEEMTLAPKEEWPRIKNPGCEPYVNYEVRHRGKNPIGFTCPERTANTLRIIDIEINAIGLSHVRRKYELLRDTILTHECIARW